MSEFHPNRQKNVRTKPRVTMRRIFECWPLLVWAGVLYLGYAAYNTGVVFKRMNGAVDVYQENATPIHSGRLKEVKVKRGQHVEPGTVLAVMDPSEYLADLEGLKRSVAADRVDDSRKMTSDLIDLESELRKIQRESAEDTSIIAEMDKQINALETYRKAAAIPDNQFNALYRPILSKLNLDKSKSEGRKKVNDGQETDVQKEVDRVRGLIKTMADEAVAIAGMDALTTKKEDIMRQGFLRENEQQKFVELRTKIELCEIRTTKGGTVDRITKDPGEYTQVGESVMKIVDEPHQIVCFLPQDQTDDLKVGATVYVVSTADKKHYYQSKVLQMSPRINNLQDSTSPLPNHRVHGRDVIVDYPPDCLPKNGNGYMMLPGQTVIIHTSKPGELGVSDWFNKLFHNDDTPQ